MGGHKEIILTESTRQTRSASKIFRHENYGAVKGDYDIALVKLNAPVTYNDYVSPACVADTRPADDTPAIATGWGNQGTRSSVIRELSQGDAASCATQEANNLDGTAFFGPLCLTSAFGE